MRAEAGEGHRDRFTGVVPSEVIEVIYLVGSIKRNAIDSMTVPRESVKSTRLIRLDRRLYGIDGSAMVENRMEFEADSREVKSGEFVDSERDELVCNLQVIRGYWSVGL